MDKTKNSSETTGPIRVVLFKGTQKPTTKQITEKHMVALYTVIGFLIFLLLFLVTTLLIISDAKSEVDGKYSIAAKEIIRLRKMIRNMSGYENSMEIRESSSSPDEKKKPEETSSIFTRGNYDLPTVDQNNESSAGNPLSLNAAENEMMANEAVSSTSGQSVSMKAEITRFRPFFDESANTFRYRYLLANQNESNVQLEGKAIVIVKVGENYYSNPSVQLANGNPVNPASGILFRIQRQKEMTGQLRISAKANDVKEVTIILNDLSGQEIIRRVFAISNP